MDPLLEGLPRNSDGLPVAGGVPLQRLLGRGSTGAVYHAIHPGLGCPVAVKLLAPDHVRRFESEIRATSGVSNDHLVRILDSGVAAETPFLVMEFIEGGTAGDAVRRAGGGLPERDALDIVIGATRGLVALHAAGIVHRDVKPDNILLQEGKLSRAKLADPGLVGTPGYMAPEQARDPAAGAPASDIFAMGGALYALLAARAPFSDPSLATILRRTVTESPAPLADSVSRATRDLVDRCLRKNPAERFATAQDLLANLEAVR